MSIRAAIFDLDDTLFLERDYVRSGYAAVAEYLRWKTGRDDPFEQWLWNRFERGMAGEAFDDINAEFALGLTKGNILKLVEVYREHVPTIAPLPGVPELLGRLHADYALGLLADGFLPAQRLKLAALGLERFFDVVIFNEEQGRHSWKPSPAGFELMQRKVQNGIRDSGFGTREETAESLPAVSLPNPETRFPIPAAFAYISDNPAKDFVAANRLGWRTVQLIYPGQIHARLPAPDGGKPQFTARLPGDVVEILRQ